jgi:POT family proton-dependent oligopeptide transporter
MMGVWFVGSALGNLIAGLYGGHFDPENVQQMPDLFMAVVQFGVGGSILFLALSPLMNRWVKTK